MPYLNVESGSAEFGKPFSALLNDDGCRSLPVQARRISEFWVRVGSNDLRQITSIFAADGRCTICILPSRLNAAAQARQKRIQEAVAAGRALQAALGKLDAADKMLVHHQLGRWLEMPQSTPVEPPARQGEPDRRAAPSMASTSAGSKG